MATRRPPDPTRKPDVAKEIPKVIKADEKASPLSARKSVAPRVKKSLTQVPAGVEISDDVRRAMIAECAYLRAERRGFVSGQEEEDWLAAEAEVDRLLKARHGGTSQ